MQLIDTHVHLMMPDYENVGGVGAVLERMKAAGVTHCVVPGIDYKTSKEAIALGEQYPQIVPAIGLHPTNEFEDLEQFKTLAELPEVKAIGEIGTDFRVNDLTEQEKRFRFFLEL